MNTTLRMSIEIMVVRMISKLPKRICYLSVVKFDCMHEGIRPLLDESKVVVVARKKKIMRSVISNKFFLSEVETCSIELRGSTSFEQVLRLQHKKS
jgi:hypothetical protein